MRLSAALIPAVLLALPVLATPALAENRIDIIRADAPELAAYGDQVIGVRTLALVNPNQIDLSKIDPKGAKPDPLPRYDRPVTIEVWYPAARDAKGPTALKAFMRDGKTEVTLTGKAILGAAPASGTRFPLVIVSHGYPGNRHLMSPLAENIASKGYVVVAIDHTDSTYSTYQVPYSFRSTLLNRALDQAFVLSEITKLSRDGASFLNGIVDTDRVGVIGYSMGGYGTLITAGAGLTDAAVTATEGQWSAPFGVLAVHKSGSETQNARPDPRIKTAITFAPAGMSNGFFSAETLKGVKVPVLFVGGSIDDVVGYEKGVRATWAAATSVDRALLTFENANHNAGAVMAPPAEANAYSAEFKMNLANHYIDAVWDNVRMNNVSEHFVTAWLGKYLKADAGMDAYLKLVPAAADGVWSVEKDGTPKPNHTYWKGFPNRTAKALRFETLKAGE